MRSVGGGIKTHPTPPTERISRPDRVVELLMRLNKPLRIAALATGFTLATLAASTASAQDWQVARKGDWIVTGRITDVAPAADDAITTAARQDTALMHARQCPEPSMHIPADARM